MTEEVNLYPVFKAATRANPQALYEVMRQEDPVHRAISTWSGNPIWIITRYDDCVTVLKDQHIGKEMWKRLSPDIYKRYGKPPSADNPWEVINHHLLNIDPPDHTRLRGLVHKAFTPRTVENLRPRIQDIATELLDKMSDSSEGDLIDEFAFPLPIIVIAEMLGVPVEDRDKFREWTKIILFSSDEDRNYSALMEFAGYMSNMIDDHYQNPRDDILTALIQAEEEGERLDRMELMSMLFLLLVAGHETTVNLIGNGTLALLQHPAQMDKLRNDPGLIRTAIEEMLRYNGPVETTTTRWAFDDIQLGGKVIETGDMVLAALSAANRDPAQFDEPNTFDITRDPNKHIAFGHGIHYCVGAPLARMEGVIAINTLLKRLPNLQLNTSVDELEWSESILLHGMKAMPVRY